MTPGPLDTCVVLWRTTRLILRIAKIYKVRPGGYGSYRLQRRVARHAVVAGLSEEAIQMRYAAYGPAAVEAASKGFRGLFDWMIPAGWTLASHVEPITGTLVAGALMVGKGTADVAGGIAAQIAGPLLQGVLNAILTIRIGLAAQNECRLVALNPQERRTQSAGIVSALLGFFLSVRRTAVPSVVIGNGGGQQHTTCRLRNTSTRRRAAP